MSLGCWGVASLIGPSRSVQAAGVEVFRLSLADASLGLHLERNRGEETSKSWGTCWCLVGGCMFLSLTKRTRCVFEGNRKYHKLRCFCWRHLPPPFMRSFNISRLVKLLLITRCLMCYAANLQVFFDSGDWSRWIFNDIIKESQWRFWFATQGNEQ